MTRRNNVGGRLRIGDHWSAISIIAQSQDNPLKAVAEFVENSIDARARNIDIVRGRERGQPYLKIVDDGEGVRRDAGGAPDFRYVVFASQSRVSQLRYIARLFVKELVLRNFPGAWPGELLDRMLELMLYMEGSLK
ncbi:MAG: hypothetical protein F4089_11960 [Gammaproteobacteria bacterium]|nr:hypothetical protein [Gammaproteobacteria bacterium]MYJ75763.1 hypothetical protein [Gammaproteobacteria bacterium]